LPVAPNLLDRRFDGWLPNQAWVADITYVATGEGWLYLAAVMDLASRRIVGWSMSETIDAKLVCAALRSAHVQRMPDPGLLVHTDRGSQYASHDYRKMAEDLAITMSMSRKADCWDNAAMESFFKTLKVERIYQVGYDTRAQARLDIVSAGPCPRWQASATGFDAKAHGRQRPSQDRASLHDALNGNSRARSSRS
jgi:putative transposase